MSAAGDSALRARIQALTAAWVHVGGDRSALPVLTSVATEHPSWSVTRVILHVQGGALALSKGSALGASVASFGSAALSRAEK